MTKTQEKRAAQLEALVDAAETTIGRDGLAALKARDLAQGLGVSLGGLYNIVGDLDELVLRVGARTLAQLDRALADAVAGSADPVAALVALARAYCDFAAANQPLWRALFEQRLASDAALPQWHADIQLDLFRHVAGPLRALLPGQGETERSLLSRTLFSAVHGVAALGLDEKLVAVPRPALESQAALLVRAICAGLVNLTEK